MGLPLMANILWRARWWTPALVLPALIIAACQGNPSPVANVATPPGQQGQGYARPELLTEPLWLEENLGHDGLVVLDVRSAASYLGGHIPGAVNLNPRALGDDQPVRGMVGPAEQVEGVLESLGMSNDSRVVIYDDDRGMWAARVFWIMDYYGKTGGSLLNGGFARWRAEGRPVGEEVPEATAGNLSLGPDEARYATKEHVLAALDDREVVLLDARTPNEYSGEVALSARGGHIPGAVNVPWERAMTSGDPQVWRPRNELEQIYQDAGAVPGKEIVVYCQTGVRASHSYFTLRLMGYDNMRVYDGSWEEWGNEPGLPAERPEPPSD